MLEGVRRFLKEMFGIESVRVLGGNQVAAPLSDVRDSLPTSSPKEETALTADALLQSGISTVRSYAKLKSRPENTAEIYAPLLQDAPSETFPRENGYAGLQRYPFASNHDGKNPEEIDLQAADLPYLGDASILGNNQAFFFVKKTPEGMQENTDALKKLIGNVYDNGTKFTLMIDRDVMAPLPPLDPQADKPYAGHPFVDKYWELRGENLPDGSPDEKTRRALLGEEVEIISGFLNRKGVLDVVKEVIAERKGIPKEGVGSEATQFLQEQFKVMGVETKQPLANAVWRAEGPLGDLLFKQSYDKSTHNINRACEFGTEPELSALRNRHEGASAILDAVQHMKRLPKVNLTLGTPQQGLGGQNRQR